MRAGLAKRGRALLATTVLRVLAAVTEYRRRWEMLRRGRRGSTVAVGPACQRVSGIVTPSQKQRSANISYGYQLNFARERNHICRPHRQCGPMIGIRCAHIRPAASSTTN